MILILFCKIIAVVLDAVLLFMFARALLPFLGFSEDSRLLTFFFVVTEPFVIPVRFILQKLNLFQNSFIDVSFTVSFLLISMLSTLLPMI